MYDKNPPENGGFVSNLNNRLNSGYFFAIPDFLCWSDVPTLEWVDDNNLLK